MQVLITVRGQDKVNRHLSALERNLVSERTMAEVGKALEEYNTRNWARGVTDLPDTDLRWPEHKPLENTGKLRSSMRIKEVTPVSVTYGTDEYYARMLQYGTKNMKKKRVLRLPRKAIKVILGKALMRGTHAA